MAAWVELATDGRDRALAVVVDVREATALRSVDDRCVHRDAPCLELLACKSGSFVLSERGEEVDRVRELRELDGGNRATACGLFPGLVGVHDLARPRYGLDGHELHPFDMAHDGGSHACMLTNRRR